MSDYLLIGLKNTRDCNDKPLTSDAKLCSMCCLCCPTLFFRIVVHSFIHSFIHFELLLGWIHFVTWIEKNEENAFCLIFMWLLSYCCRCLLTSLPVLPCHDFEQSSVGIYVTIHHNLYCWYTFFISSEYNMTTYCTSMLLGGNHILLSPPTLI